MNINYICTRIEFVLGLVVPIIVVRRPRTGLGQFVRRLSPTARIEWMAQCIALVCCAPMEAGKDPHDSSPSAWYCSRNGYMAGGLRTWIKVHLTSRLFF